ncbi:MAG: cupin domain-containing protein [Geobacteraceae bacterium]|nr:cupin domain-containing protein [Geobacteraceae bacterium]
MLPVLRNILTGLPSAQTAEVFETLVESHAVRIERIVSHGQTTPVGQWYEQERAEWVLVLAGAAELLFDDGQPPRRLATGDYALIPAACRHRVAWTDPERTTVWLAIHFTADQTP